MSEQIRISAKNLGAIALNNFCPRCFWIKMKLENKLPYQIFPGIFNSIDSFTKTIVHSWFDKKGKQPDWLNNLGKFKGYINPPHFSKFQTVVDKYNILLTGGPDGILINDDDTYTIIDYKTAKFTGAQDELFPMYEAQLNAYAFIAKQLNYPEVTKLALIYAEPITNGPNALLDEYYHDYGFAMGFNVNIEKVTLNQEILIPLFETLRKITDLNKEPTSLINCGDCSKVNSLISVLKH